MNCPRCGWTPGTVQLKACADPFHFPESVEVRLARVDAAIAENLRNGLMEEVVIEGRIHYRVTDAGREKLRQTL